MRPLLFITLFAASLVWCSSAEAYDKARMEAPKSSIILKAESSPRLSVTFNHSTHKDVKCDTCHHKPRCGICHYAPELSKSPAASCSTEGCHTIQGKSTDEQSRFMAFHTRDSQRSCFGCHRAAVSEHPDFKGCRPCHSDKAPVSAE